MKDHFFLSLKNLKNRGVRSWLTMLGVFIGIAAIVSLISLGQGLKEAVTGQFSSLGTDKLVLENIGTGFGPPGSTSVRKLNKGDLELVESTPGVKIAIPRLIRVVGVEYNNERIFNSVASVTDDNDEIEIIKELIDADVSLGRFLKPGDRGKIVLGSAFDEDTFNKKIRIGSNLKVQDEKFEVLGILDKSGSFLINDAVFMMENDMEKILGLDDEIDIIAIQVEDEGKIEEVSKELERKIRRDRNQKPGEEDFSVQTPLQSISSVNTILNIINLIFIGIAMISLVVGGIGIANTMYTSVLERTSEIGVMKSIGARNSDILKLFIIEAGLLGFVGGLIGALMGLGLAFAVSAIAAGSLGGLVLKVQVSYLLIISAIIFSFLIGTIAGILPAMQASKLNPVEALRK
jgi:putative ABC transport system permease protein